MDIFNPLSFCILNDDETRVRYIANHSRDMSVIRPDEQACVDAIFARAIMHFFVPWVATEKGFQLRLGDLEESETVSLEQFQPLRDQPVSWYARKRPPNITVRMNCFAHALMDQIAADYDAHCHVDTCVILLIHALRFYHHCIRRTYGTKNRADGEVILFIESDGDVVPLQESAHMLMK